MNTQTVRRWFPVILTGISILVYLRLGCVEGTGCMNVTEYHPYQSQFQQFMNNWQIG